MRLGFSSGVMALTVPDKDASHIMYSYIYIQTHAVEFMPCIPQDSSHIPNPITNMQQAKVLYYQIWYSQRDLSASGADRCIPLVCTETYCI